VVEDDEVSRKTLAAMRCRRGYAVAMAVNGKDRGPNASSRSLQRRSEGQCFFLKVAPSW